MSQPNNDRLLRAALKYAEHGWPVFPIKPRAKEPLTAHGFKDAIRNEDQIRAWWTDTPTANIGVPTGAVSGVVVVDVDGEGAEEGLRELGAQVPTLTSLTAKGRHLLFKYPGQEIQNRTRLRPYLDIRADGGYIIAAPSVHPSGQRYQWDNDHGMGWGTPLAPLPEKLLKELTNGRRHAAAPLPDVIPEGARNATLTSLAGSMRRRGAAVSAILAALEAENAEKCKPPLPYRELAMIATSVSRYDTEPREKSEKGELVEDDQGLSSLFSLNSPAVWPQKIRSVAYHGLAGKFVRVVEPHTEADPTAVLVQFLVMAGNVMGRNPYWQIGPTRHYLNENLLIIGLTASGRKGTAWDEAFRLFRIASPDWAQSRNVSGLSSGEGLIWAVRDPIEKQVARREKGRIVEYQTEITDHGVDDKRLLVLETEFGKTLTVASREGCTLSPTVRQAWESGNLSVLTKSCPVKATNAHISIVAHCTPEEVRRLTKRAEVASGFLNRFVIVCARRSKELPSGGSLDDEDLKPLAGDLYSALVFAEGVERMTWAQEAEQLWPDIYSRLTAERPGLLGAALSRAALHVLRFACIYALLDLSTEVKQSHLEAALALWDYMEQSVGFVFGGALGDPVSDELYQALIDSEQGISRTEMYALFDRHVSKTALNQALERLQGAGQVYCKSEKTKGRSREVWKATRKAAAVGLPLMG